MRYLRHALLGFVSLVGAMAAESGVLSSPCDQDYSKQGPCTTSRYRRSVAVGVEGVNSPLSLLITLPTRCPEPGISGPPYPVLIFFSGFQLRAAWYSRIVNRAASWGYAVVQYDTRLFSITTIKAEMQAFEPLLTYLKHEAAPENTDSALAGKLDFDRLVVAGHSRGGKLAALLFANDRRANIRAAWLIDPIDETRYAPESADYPSATKALAAAGKAVGITGGGVISQCNNQGNYPGMFAGAGEGSWLAVLPDASHSQFADAGCVINAVQDALCGKGRDRRRDVAGLTVTPMLSWFCRELKKGEGVREEAAPLSTFWNWVRREETRGKLVFSEKAAVIRRGEGTGVREKETAMV